MKKGWIFGLAVLLVACNDSNTPNVETDKTMGVKDSARGEGGVGDTSITTDSRRNAPGTYNYITDTGNKTETGGPKDAPHPTKPSNQ
ncbi:MAG: hypothetical protein EOO16_10270 [Chitinophagaceae bacterium]|nr:MAG: hypothetical protein EOO16_10270 [Chitinophagaceae bacterium]